MKNIISQTIQIYISNNFHEYFIRKKNKIEEKGKQLRDNFTCKENMMGMEIDYFI